MDKSKLISKFNKIKEIKKHRLYFKEDNPVLTDASMIKKRHSRLRK